MLPNVFWVKAKSGRSHSQTLVPDDGDDVGCADGSDTMIGGKISDGGGGISSLVAQAEENVDARLHWAGYGGLRTEVRDCLTKDGILLIVKGDENLGGLAEFLSRGIPREGKVPDEEHKVH